MPPQPEVQVALPPPFFLRLWLALVCLFRITFDPLFAGQVALLRAPPPLLAIGDRPTLPATPIAISAAQLSRAEQAMHLLSLFQREGRLIDFCTEDLAGFSDAQVGAAARGVHDGCKKALKLSFGIVPIQKDAEGAIITVPPGFSPAAIRLTGNVVGDPPFKGVLRHHGWKITEVRLPPVSGDATLLSPAEVELS